MARYVRSSAIVRYSLLVYMLRWFECIAQAPCACLLHATIVAACKEIHAGTKPLVLKHDLFEESRMISALIRCMLSKYREVKKDERMRILLENKTSPSDWHKVLNVLNMIRFDDTKSTPHRETPLNWQSKDALAIVAATPLEWCDMPDASEFLGEDDMSDTLCSTPPPSKKSRLDPSPSSCNTPAITMRFGSSPSSSPPINMKMHEPQDFGAWDFAADIAELDESMGTTPLPAHKNGIGHRAKKANREHGKKAAEDLKTNRCTGPAAGKVKVDSQDCELFAAHDLYVLLQSSTHTHTLTFVHSKNAFISLPSSCSNSYTSNVVQLVVWSMSFALCRGGFEEAKEQHPLCSVAQS